MASLCKGLDNVCAEFEAGVMRSIVGNTNGALERRIISESKDKEKSETGSASLGKLFLENGHPAVK